jgi:hypothetical protein
MTDNTLLTMTTRKIFIHTREPNDTTFRDALNSLDVVS